MQCTHARKVPKKMGVSATNFDQQATQQEGFMNTPRHQAARCAKCISCQARSPVAPTQMSRKSFMKDRYWL